MGYKGLRVHRQNQPTLGCLAFKPVASVDVMRHWAQLTLSEYGQVANFQQISPDIPKCPNRRSSAAPAIVMASWLTMTTEE